MMTSSGSGAYRVGGSGSLSSSSNLSALAPPFQVDKPLPKPNSTNPPVNYHDVPMYGAYFDPAGAFWNSSSSSSASGLKGTSTVSPTSSNIFGYTGSQPNTSLSSVCYASSGAGAAYDPFSYEPFPKSMSTSVNEAAKPYYPPYVSPPPQKDGYLSLGVGSGHGYDLLSSSDSAHLSGCGSSHVDRQQGISGDGDYKLTWGGFWSGLNENDHGEWSEYAQGFGSKDSNVSDLSSNKSPFFVDGSSKSQPFVDVNTDPFVDGSTSIHLPCDGSNKSHLREGACVTQDLSSHGDVSTVLDGCFDIFGGAYHLGSLGIDQQNSRSFSDFYSRMPTSVSTGISKESPHLQEPVLESVTSFCDSQKAKGSSTRDHFSQTGLYPFGCTSATSTFPITVTKLQYGGCSSSTGSAFSDLKLNSVGSDAATKSNTSAGYSLFYQKEPRLPLGLKCQSRAIIRRPVSSKVASSSQAGGIEDSSLDGKNACERNKSAPQVPHTGGFNLEVNDADAVYCAEKHSGGSDVHNPAEDSPCWKGASSNRFSPFRLSEGVASDVLVETLDECESLCTQDRQVKRSLADTSDSGDFPFVKVSESISLQRPIDFDCASKESDDCRSANPKLHCFDLNTGDGLQSADDCYVSTKECCILDKSDSDPKSSLSVQLSKGGEVSSPRNMSEAAGSGKSGDCSSVVAEFFSGAPSNVDISPAISPPGGEGSLKYCQPARRTSDSKLDVDVLLKTMTKLSKIFQSYCSGNQAAVLEQHSIDVKNIINNLNASMSMAAGQTTPTMVSPHGSSFQKEIPVDQMVNDAEAVAAAVNFGRAAEDVLDSVSFKDEANSIGDANMIEAIKKILHENIQVEEMDQEKLLYKNLWLEAEASLCAMTAKARFLRVKAEMERARDGRICTKDRESSPSSLVSADVHEAVKSATKDKDSPALDECRKSSATSLKNHTEVFESKNCHIPETQAVRVNSLFNEGLKQNSKEICFPSWHASGPSMAGNDSDGSRTITHGSDAETVMARYQILKSRVENSETVNHKFEQSSGDLVPGKISIIRNLNQRRRVPKARNRNWLDRFRKARNRNRLARCQIVKCQLDNSDTVNECSRSPSEGNYLPGKDSSSPRYHILESQFDNSDSLYDGKLSVEGENNLLDRVSLSPGQQLQNSELLSSSVSVPEEDEASVMARFRIIQSRVNRSNSVDKHETLRHTNGPAVEDETEGPVLLHQKSDTTRSVFGPYPDFTEVADEDRLGFCVDREAYSTSSCQTNRLDNGIFEGWYDNDSSSSDWEHVNKEDLRKQN